MWYILWPATNTSHVHSFLPTSTSTILHRLNVNTCTRPSSHPLSLSRTSLSRSRDETSSWPLYMPSSDTAISTAASASMSSELLNASSAHCTSFSTTDMAS